MTTILHYPVPHKKVILACCMAIGMSVCVTDNARAWSLSDLDPTKPLRKAAEEAKKELDKTIENAGDSLKGMGEAIPKAMADGVKTVESLGNGTIETVTKANTGTLTVLELNGAGTVTTFTKASGDALIAVQKSGNDVVATYKKSIEDTSNQARRSYDDAVEAGGAMLRYQERVVADQGRTLSKAERSLREGKVVDAAWGMAIEPLQSQEKNFFKATQESALIQQAASSAAAAYGGPGGAAAYAAWSTYRATGDATAAMRVGIIAGVQSQLGQGQTLAPDAPMSEVIKKASLAGAAGGIAIAAQGGDEAAIKDGFLKSSGAVLIQAGRDRAQAYSPKVKAAMQFAECISAKDVDCVSNTTYARDAKGKLIKQANGLVAIDPNKLDPKRQVGQWTGIDLNAAEAKSSKIVADISKLPGTGNIATMKGRWIITTKLGSSASLEYGAPMVVLTAVGDQPPFKFTRQIVRKGANPGAIISAEGGNYSCHIGKIHRTIKTSISGTSCNTKYYRENGAVVVIWNTPSHPAACVPKAKAFVQHLASRGVDCAPQ